jgi:hypothetical protein
MRLRAPTPSPALQPPATLHRIFSVLNATTAKTTHKI